MSIRSMTGFGRGEGSFGGLNFTVDIKSVNHRYFDFSSRIYKDYAYLEEPIRKRIAESVARGKIDVYFHTEKSAEPIAPEAVVDKSLAKAYLDAANLLGDEFGVNRDLSAARLITLPDVLTLKQPEVDEGEVTKAVLDAVDEALASFLSMRETEGAKLKADLQANLSFVLDAVEKIEVLALNPIDGTDDSISSFAEDNNLTFPMAASDISWEGCMELTAYPTTVVIDRYGMIAMIHKGYITETEVFSNVFEYFTSDEYVQTTVRNISDIE